MCGGNRARSESPGGGWLSSRANVTIRYNPHTIRASQQFFGRFYVVREPPILAGPGCEPKTVFLASAVWATIHEPLRFNWSSSPFKSPNTHRSDTFSPQNVTNAHPDQYRLNPPRKPGLKSSSRNR